MWRIASFCLKQRGQRCILCLHKVGSVFLNSQREESEDCNCPTGLSHWGWALRWACRTERPGFDKWHHICTVRESKWPWHSWVNTGPSCQSVVKFSHCLICSLFLWEQVTWFSEWRSTASQVSITQRDWWRRSKARGQGPEELAGNCKHGGISRAFHFVKSWII